MKNQSFGEMGMTFDIMRVLPFVVKTAIVDKLI